MRYKIVYKPMALALIILSMLSCKSLYVPFGNAKQTYAKINDGVIRIYFDRFGFIYPDKPINDEDIKKSYGLLTQYYLKNISFYEQACKDNLTASSTKRPDTLGTNEDPLQEALVAKYVTLINQNISNKELVFIIHGFNEFPINARDSSSYEEMKDTRHLIESQFPKTKFKFVEIYWDGLSQELGLKLCRYINSFRIWNDAQASATNTGLELRRLLSHIDKPQIHVITHSHGAGVITTALFDVVKFKAKYYDKKGNWLNEVKMKYNLAMYNTPAQTFHVGMLAPAIPGQNVFDEYYQRTISGKDTSTNIENYGFVLGFTENDPVNLKFKIATRKLGSTTLGCKPKELVRTEALFNKRAILDHIDFSKYEDNSRQKDHSWLIYLKHNPAINVFMEQVFK